MRDEFIKSLLKLAKDDKSIILLTADLGFGVFEEFENLFPEQYFNVGISEQNMIGLGTGLALEGKKVVAYSIGNFPTLRCLEQIRNDACYHKVNLTIVSSGGGYSYGQLGYSHHATEDLSILRALPNIKVISPCSNWESGEATKILVNDNSVSYLRLDKTSADDSHLPKDNFNLMNSRKYRDGNDITIISTGGILDEALIAAKKLSAKSIECRVIGMHTIKPIDKHAIHSAASETGGLVIVEENNMIGGLGSAVSDYCLQNMIIPEKFLSIGINDTYSSVVGDQYYLRKINSIDSDSIFTKVIELFKSI